MNPLQDLEFLPFKLDLAADRVLLLRLDAQQRADAAFLDERAWPATPEGYWVPIADWLAAPAVVPIARLDWIFHIGHCGSTMLARLLQSWPQVEVLREPLPLRVLAGAPGAEGPRAQQVLLRLARDWARPLPPKSRTVVKTTSSCNGLAAHVAGLHESSRVLLMDMALEPWLATILKSPASVTDVLASAPERNRLLAAANADIACELADLQPHRQCAIGWFAERVRYAGLASGDGRTRFHRVDFDNLLTEPEATLSRIASHLELTPEEIASAMASPWWRRYSKAGQYAYDPRDRDADLQLARVRHGDRIRDAQVWLDGFMSRHPDIATDA